MKKLLLPIFALSCCALTSFAQQSTEPTVAETYQMVYAGEEPMFWMDAHADAYHSGNGTKESPYMISTPEELALLARHVHDCVNTKGVYYELANDIDLNGKIWFPIGLRSDKMNVKVAFDGIFDGKNHRIYHLKTIELGDLMSMGLFGVTQQHAEIRNVIIGSGEVIGSQSVGAIVGKNVGLVENCINRATVGCSMYHCGGIVGSNSRNDKLEQTSVIRHCINYGSIDAGLEWANGMAAGGIAGTNICTVEECINYGDVRASNGGAGGLVGYLEGGKVYNSFAICNVSVEQDQMGGIVADLLGRSANCEIQNCYFSGQLITETPEANQGGVAAFAMFPNANTLLVKNCFYNKDLYTGSEFGKVQDVSGKFTFENNKGMTTAEMKADAFVAALNKGFDKNVWMADSKQVNDGFPVLSFLEKMDTGIAQVESHDGCLVFAENGQIRVLGDVADTEMVQVYTYAGVQAFAGVRAELETKSFGQGLYVVVLGTTSYKVLVP